jgi:ABC-2 type transport system ATP-binding protein
VDAVLAVANLHKTYRPGLFEADVEVLRGLSFEVCRGEIFGFLGPNGSGKTTTLKAIAGIVKIDSGEIRVCGFPHATLEAKRRFGFMPENPYHYRHLTGREMLRFVAGLTGLSGGGLEARIEEVLARVGMADRADRPMRTFSKGMLQRTSFAQALLGRPDLLLLDEPMSGLDPVGRRDVRDLILAERDRGTTVFFSTHILPDVETLCDRIALVAEGRLQATGRVRDLLAQEAERYEATFSGLEPATLRTPVDEIRVGDEAVWVRVSASHRSRLILELAERGAPLLSLTPLRSSLEEFVLGKHGGEES